MLTLQPWSAVYLIGDGKHVFISRDIEVKNVKSVFGVQLVRNADERRTSGLRHPVVYYHHVVFVVRGNGNVVLKKSQ